MGFFTAHHIELWWIQRKTDTLLCTSTALTTPSLLQCRQGSSPKIVLLSTVPLQSWNTGNTLWTTKSHWMRFGTCRSTPKHDARKLSGRRVVKAPSQVGATGISSWLQDVVPPCRSLSLLSILVVDIHRFMNLAKLTWRTPEGQWQCRVHLADSCLLEWYYSLEKSVISPWIQEVNRRCFLCRCSYCITVGASRSSFLQYGF